MSSIGAEPARLEELRLSALQDYIDAHTMLGEVSEQIAELRALTSAYPLHEGFWTRLILALAAVGRQADALEMYSHARTTLVDQVGVEPGTELRKAHSRILNGQQDGGDILRVRPAPGHDSPLTSAPTVIPRQLPPVAAGFSGRDRELRQLSSMLLAARDTEPLALSIALITGVPGVGKSALAKYWTHSMAHLFPPRSAVR